MLSQARAVKFKRHQGLTAFEKVMGSLVEDSRTESACALCHRPFDNQTMMSEKAALLDVVTAVSIASHSFSMCIFSGEFLGLALAARVLPGR